MRKKSWKGSLALGSLIFYGLFGSNSVLANEAVEATYDQTVTVEDKTAITTSSTSTNRKNGVYVDFGGNVVIGNDVDITHTSGYISNAILVENDPQGKGGSVGQSTLTAGDNLTIKVDGYQANGIYVKSNNNTQGSKVVVGDNLNITTGGYQNNHGIYVRNSGSSVTVGNGMQISTDGLVSYGLFAEQGASITAGTDSYIVTNGSASAGLYATGADSQINLGDRAKIEQKGSSGYGVDASYGGQIALGNQTEVITGNDFGYGVYAYGATSATAPSSNIVAGDDLTIKTEGSRLATGIYASGKASIATGDRTTVTTMGDDAAGLQAVGEQAQIQTGRQTQIRTNGIESHGVYAYKGQVVLGDGAQIHTSGDEALGAYVYGETAVANFGKQASIITAGQDTISVYAGKGGTVYLNQGSTIVANGDESNALAAAKADSLITVESGGTIIAGGSNTNAVYAFDGGTVKLNGQQYIEAAREQGAYALLAQGAEQKDGTINRGQIEAEGSLTIFGGVKAAEYGIINLAMQQGSYFEGFTEFSPASGEVNVDMTDSYWNVTSNSSAQSDLADFASEVNKLTLQNSVVDLRNLADYSILKINELSGNNGQFLLKSDISALSSDLVLITGPAQGAYTINVRDKGSTVTTGEEVVTVVKADKSEATFAIIREITPEVLARSFSDSEESITFALANEAIDAGGFSYKLRQSETDPNSWELYSDGEASTGGSASINTFLGSYLLSNAEIHTMMQRLGELRDKPTNAGAWARTYGGKYQAGRNQLLRGFDMRYSGLQIGLDKTNLLENGASLTWGGMFGYSSGRLAYPTGKTELDGKTLGIYGSYLEQNGFYADLVLKYMWMNNKFNVLDNTLEEVRGDKLKTGGLGTSVEIGKRFSLSQSENGWYLEPQAQLSYARQNGGSFTASNGLHVDVAGFDSLQGRLGLLAGYELNAGGRPQNIYAKVSRVKEFKGDVVARFNGTPVETSYGGSWWSYGVGYAAQIAKNQQLYFDIERTSGGPFKQPWAVNVGFRLNF